MDGFLLVGFQTFPLFPWGLGSSCSSPPTVLCGETGHDSQAVHAHGNMVLCKGTRDHSGPVSMRWRSRVVPGGVISSFVS